MWILLEKNFGAIFIKLPDANTKVETFLFACGHNKNVHKSPILIHSSSYLQIK